jgi:hypothetical protein
MYGMTRSTVVVFLLVLGLLLQHRGTAHAGPITFSNGAYDGVVIAIADNVPAHDCRNIVDKLEVSLVPYNTLALKQVIGANFKLYVSLHWLDLNRLRASVQLFSGINYET